MDLLGGGGMSLPDVSMGCVLSGGIGFLTLCGSDLICLVLLVGLLCVGAEGVFFLSVTWISLLQDVGLFLGVAFPVVLCLLWKSGSG